MMTSFNLVLILMLTIACGLVLSKKTSPRDDLCQLIEGHPELSFQHIYYNAAEERIHFWIDGRNFVGKMMQKPGGAAPGQSYQVRYIQEYTSRPGGIKDPTGKLMETDIRGSIWTYTLNQFADDGYSISVALQPATNDQIKTIIWYIEPPTADHLGIHRTTAPASPRNQVYHVPILNTDPGEKRLYGYVFYQMEGGVHAVDVATFMPEIWKRSAFASMARESYKKVLKEGKIMQFFQYPERGEQFGGWIFEEKKPEGGNKLQARPAHTRNMDGNIPLFPTRPPSGFMFNGRVYLFNEPTRTRLYSWTHERLYTIELPKDHERADLKSVELKGFVAESVMEFFNCYGPPGDFAQMPVGPSNGGEAPHDQTGSNGSQGSDDSLGPGSATTQPSTGPPSWLLYGGILLVLGIALAGLAIFVMVKRRKQASGRHTLVGKRGQSGGSSTKHKAAPKIPGKGQEGGKVSGGGTPKKTSATPTTTTPTMKKGGASTSTTNKTPTKKKGGAATPTTTKTPEKKFGTNKEQSLSLDPPTQRSE